MPPKKAAPRPPQRLSAAHMVTPQCAITQPDAYFQYLRDLTAETPRTTPIQVNLTKRVIVKSDDHAARPVGYVLVTRQDRRSMRISPAFFACFYDLPLGTAMEKLGITERVYRKVKKGLNVPRWPYQALVSQGHSTITMKTVGSSRLQYMRWAWENQDTFTYSLLYGAHKEAGYKLDKLPVPGVDQPLLQEEQAARSSEVQGPVCDLQPSDNVPSRGPSQEQDPGDDLPLFGDADLDGMDWSQLFVGGGEGVGLLGFENGAL